MVTFRLDNKSISFELPDPAKKKKLDFTVSTFFAYPNRRLLSPAEVRALSNEMANVPRPGFVRFEELKLNVKFGPHVIRRLFKDKVPVPEVFGWRIDDHGYVFIYMELIKGPALLEHWGLLDTAGKGAVSDQLAVLLQSLRQLEQDPSDQFIAFNDQFALLHQLPFPTRYDDPYRCYLPDDVGIKFTHADFHRANIIALYAASYEVEWRKDGYIDRVLQPWEDVYHVWSEYCMEMGAV
ncbi:hypothetical protein BJX66DRAFT_330592 [Aspergillus keveii]|uniref:Aminoglycoside phosphotransferase domain-containing protein n=1 Tax=Aspergillus keveii TaxID=714993 RepID=A0ABR4FJU4_9EURO